MIDTHEDEEEAVGLLLCPKSTCKTQLGVWGNSVTCTCDTIVKPAFLIYKSKLKQGFI